MRSIRLQMPADGSSLCPDTDTIGWENNFVRVNLALVKRGVLTYRELFDAFVESIIHCPISRKTGRPLSKS